MIWALVVVLGTAVGLLVGRWWALVAAGGAGIWTGLTTSVDVVPHWFLGLAYGTFAALGIASGVLLRRRLRKTGVPR